MVRLLDAQPAPSDEDTEVYEFEYKRRLFTWAAERVRVQVSEMSWKAFWMAGMEGRRAKDVAEGSARPSAQSTIARARS